MTLAGLGCCNIGNITVFDKNVYDVVDVDIKEEEPLVVYEEIEEGEDAGDYE